MSTSTPAPKDDSTEPAAAAEPFGPLDFPADLRAAQLRLAELYAALHTHQATLPWSREAHPGFPAEAERGREHPGRPESPGWDQDAAAEYDRLWAELRAAAAAVECHKHWERCTAEGIQGADLVAARQALKHAEGAVPLTQSDVRAAA